MTNDAGIHTRSQHMVSKEENMLTNWGKYKRGQRSKFQSYQTSRTENTNTRNRADMIKLFKVIKGIYDPTCVPQVEVIKLSEDLIRTRGNNFKLIQHHCHYDLRKFNFTNRVISI